jgi:hypothetical protein
MKLCGILTLLVLWPAEFHGRQDGPLDIRLHSDTALEQRSRATHANRPEIQSGEMAVHTVRCHSVARHPPQPSLLTLRILCRSDGASWLSPGP